MWQNNTISKYITTLPLLSCSYKKKKYVKIKKIPQNYDFIETLQFKCELFISLVSRQLQWRKLLSIKLSKIKLSRKKRENKIWNFQLKRDHAPSHSITNQTSFNNFRNIFFLFMPLINEKVYTSVFLSFTITNVTQIINILYIQVIREIISYLQDKTCI